MLVFCPASVVSHVPNFRRVNDQSVVLRPSGDPRVQDGHVPLVELDLLPILKSSSLT